MIALYIILFLFLRIGSYFNKSIFFIVFLIVYCFIGSRYFYWNNLYLFSKNSWLFTYRTPIRINQKSINTLFLVIYLCGIKDVIFFLRWPSFWLNWL